MAKGTGTLAKEDGQDNGDNTAGGATEKEDGTAEKAIPTVCLVYKATAAGADGIMMLEDATTAGTRKLTVEETDYVVYKRQQQ